MALFLVTLKQDRNSNGIKLVKGMSVEVVSNYSNPLTVNGGKEVEEAFMRKYGIDLKKSAGGPVTALIPYLEVKKIG